MVEKGAQGPRKRFVSYKPKAFSSIRERFGITPLVYAQSLAHTSHWRLSSGRSGAFMFYTQDMRMLVKTIDAAEMRFLVRVADQYEQYLRRESGSFLVKFFGVHALSLYAAHVPPRIPRSGAARSF